MGSGKIVVETPGPVADRPSWVKVGVIAALGFVLGIAWPRLAGLRPGPSVPDPAAMSSGGRPSDSAPAIVAEAPMPSVAIASSAAPLQTPPLASARGGADGETQVVWPVALIRDTPKTGQVIARLPRGTRIRVGAPKDGWYPVKYGDDFGSDGWVYRGAIAK